MSTLQNEALTARFAALDHWLTSHQQLWRGQPFVQQRLDWEANFPEVSGWLRAQTLEYAEQHQLQPWRLAHTDPACPAPFVQWAQQAQRLPLTEPLPRYPAKVIPEAMLRGIPGRKWQQIEAFAACLPPSWQGSHWLDWCSGKGHLGRQLAWPNGGLCCIEHDAQLVKQGQALSRQWQVHAEHCHCDALSDAAVSHMQAGDSWVALHACGDLHTRLLRLAASAKVRRLAVAPCCYNRIQADCYAPLSQTGRASTLQLDRTLLGLPLQATVTAGASEVRTRNRNMAWRLGFDFLQRQWRAVDDYLPVPSMANRWSFESFADWCRAAAELKGIPQAPVTDWQAAEQAGWQRLAEVRNLELVQGLFRRPLELWLVLDMALFLQDQGFSVQMGEFCSIELTPRNLLLVAQR